MIRALMGTKLAVMIAGPLVVGTCGYVLIEGWQVLDGFYMSVITLSTVGYGETRELSDAGRMFTSILIATSMLCMVCWTAEVTGQFVSGELTGTFRKQKDKKMASRMSGHTVVCGGGILARTIIGQLLREKKQLVAIIGDKTNVDIVRHMHPELPIIHADPTCEMALADANTFTAKCLVAATESDYDNLLITITGKGLGTEIQIVSCAQGVELASRMFKVGANEVVCPLVLAGEQAAKLVA